MPILAILTENLALVFSQNPSLHMEVNFMHSKTFYGKGSGAQQGMEAAGELLPGT